MSVVRIGNVGVGHGHAVLLHGSDVRQRNRCFHAVEAGEADVTRGILDHIAIQIGQWTIRTHNRRHILVPKQSAESYIAHGLIRQKVGLSTIRRTAQRIPRCTVNADPDKIRERLPGIRHYLDSLRRIRSKNRRNIGGNVFQNGICGRDRAEVASCAGKRHPGCGSVLPVRGQHVERGVGWHGRGRIKQRIGPVGKRDAQVRSAVRVEVPETIAHRHAVAIPVNPGQRGQNVRGCVRNQRRVMIRKQGAIAPDEIQQMGHLFQIGGHIRVVPREVCVIKLNVDHVLNLSYG